jgi:hypothetical protein
MLQSIAAAAQAPAIDPAQYERVVNGLKAMQEIGADIGQWALLAFGGTLAVMLSTSYRKPDFPWRLIYVLLLPALLCLGIAIQQDAYIKRTYGAMLLRPPSRQVALDALSGANTALSQQIVAFEAGIAILGLWLIAYAGWWMFVDKSDSKEKPDAPE